MSKKAKGGLGRGLDSLLGGDGPMLDETPAPVAPQPAAVSASPATPAEEGIREMPLNLLQAGRYQPRTRMDESALQELADSIHEHGLLQPLVIRPIDNGRYEIIAGERRFRAAALAQLETVPVIIKEVSDENALALALIENIQREDLNPIEEAHAYQRLLTEFRLSQEELARRVARSRSAIANSVRLLRLAEEVQAFIANGVLTMGQVRPLLALESAALQREAAEYIQEHELSARGAEALVKRLAKDPNALKRSAQPAKKPAPDIFVRDAEERLTRSLGTKVRIQEGREKGKGRLEISYFSMDDLERLLGLLTETEGVGKEDKRAALRAISTQSFTV